MSSLENICPRCSEYVSECICHELEEEDNKKQKLEEVEDE